MKTFLFAVFLAVVQTPSSVPRKAADNPASASHNLNSQASPDKPAPTAPPPVVNVETHKENENTGDRIRAEDAQKSVRISELPSVSVTPGWRDDASLFFQLDLSNRDSNTGVSPLLHSEIRTHSIGHNAASNQSY